MEAQMSFSNLINEDQLVLVDFYADWCGPCQAMNPILQDVAEAAGDKVKIIKVDVDQNPKAVEQYNIKSIPRIILFHKGTIKWQCSGMQSAYNLEKIINKFYEIDLNKTTK